MSNGVKEILETGKNEKLNAQAIDPNVPTTSGATPNYGLPQWSGNDITDWFELNPAFSKIDEAMNANAVAADTAQKTGDSNTASIANLTESLNSTITRVTNVENVNTQQTQQITLNTTHLNEHDTSIQANATAIAALQEAEGGTSGDVAALQADVTTLQGQMTTANNNIATNADAIGNLTELETMVKTDLVSAVNEVSRKEVSAKPDKAVNALSGIVFNSDGTQKGIDVTNNYEFWLGFRNTSQTGEVVINIPFDRLTNLITALYGVTGSNPYELTTPLYTKVPGGGNPNTWSDSVITVEALSSTRSIRVNSESSGVKLGQMEVTDVDMSASGLNITCSFSNQNVSSLFIFRVKIVPQYNIPNNLNTAMNIHSSGGTQGAITVFNAEYAGTKPSRLI